MKTLIALMIAVVFALPCIASDIQTQKNILYPPQSSVIIQEEFLSGTTTSGTIGAYGFAVGGGTISGIASIANRPGIYQLDTSAVSGTIARLVLYLASASVLQSNVPHDVLWISRLNNNDANTTVRIGSANNTSTNPPVDGIYFEKLDGDTNWFCVTRSASVETRTDSTIAVTTNFVKFYYRRAAAGVDFKIDDVAVCGTQTTNLTAVTFVPLVQIVNSAAAAKTIDTDYFQMKYTGITR